MNVESKWPGGALTPPAVVRRHGRASNMASIANPQPCAHCGNLFVPKSPIRRYCSKSCATRSYRGGAVARFLAKVHKTDTCWLWEGCRGGKYGQVNFERQKYLAHRLAYLLFVGSIPDGYEIDHLCRTPLCVNPAHLEAVTPRVNTLRSDGITAQNARKTHCKRGHPFDEANTRWGAKGRDCKACQRIHAENSRRRHGAKPRQPERHQEDGEKR